MILLKVVWDVMNKRCKICLTEECKGAYNCNCEKCDKKLECPRVLRPTIRITNKCTQKCFHCCFSSSPTSKIQMSVEKAKEVGKFLEANEIPYANIMGGEFFCNPDWYEIISIFADKVKVLRLVTNSDWIGNEKVEVGLKMLSETYGPKITMSLSKDQWHTNKKVDAAHEFLDALGIRNNVATEEETTEGGVVPVGRGELIGYSGFYGTWGCYCQDPKSMYSFLIDEEGGIYKCGFGIFQYANVEDYLEGGFDEKFKTTNMKFYKLPLLNCKSCIRSFEAHKDTFKCVKRE